VPRSDFFAGQGQGALGAVSGARGAGDATASTGPTNSGPGPAVAGIWHIRRILLLAAAASNLPPSDTAFPGSDLLCKPKARLALLRLSKPASAIAVAWVLEFLTSVSAQAIALRSMSVIPSCAGA
jgi:hypothetical protein